ncbi:hypothetical protein [Coxiella burnetii]|uniref:hypothetical protein n=1 Tax=Coxiella burnetii TaxID=777 RepID=UPI00016311A5|nr:hypothetical protein [Coxiella burnetii]ACJ19747.1 hypothetical protein CbuK_0465 [Coxiella burnetii CbuK_Q154]EAX31744.2 hypothetical protein A35_02325 [Coxiella burnetii 'MSU Goat Q177']UYK69971.1 hypothetical protein OHM78_01370 [Coxiella burnetii]
MRPELTLEQRLNEVRRLYGRVQRLVERPCACVYRSDLGLPYAVKDFFDKPQGRWVEDFLADNPENLCEVIENLKEMTNSLEHADCIISCLACCCMTVGSTAVGMPIIGLAVTCLALSKRIAISACVSAGVGISGFIFSDCMSEKLKDEIIELIEELEVFEDPAVRSAYGLKENKIKRAAFLLGSLDKNEDAPIYRSFFKHPSYEKNILSEIFACLPPKKEQLTFLYQTSTPSPDEDNPSHPLLTYSNR